MTTIQAPSVLSGVVLLVLSATAATSLPSRSFERAELFATCSGRLAAMATRQRTLNHSGAEENARLAREFDMLLEATMPDAQRDGVPPAQGPRWRSQGRRELAALLSDVDYSFDSGRAERARQAVDARLEACRSVLLPKA